jgi:DNA-binding Xre family transcriptional regulator
MTTRVITYTWRLRELMARRHIFTAKDLTPLLHDRGITLTHNAIWRIVTQSPDRISLQLLAALCDVLDVTPNDLITFTAHDAKTLRNRKAVGEGVPDVRDYRPVRARIVPDDDDK